MAPPVRAPRDEPGLLRFQQPSAVQGREFHSHYMDHDRPDGDVFIPCVTSLVSHQLQYVKLSAEVRCAEQELRVQFVSRSSPISADGAARAGDPDRPVGTAPPVTDTVNSWCTVHPDCLFNETLYKRGRSGNVDPHLSVSKSSARLSSSSVFI